MKAISRDTDLTHLISDLRNSAVSRAESIQQLVQSTLNKVSIEVAEELLKRNALLLQDAHDRFCSIATALSHNLHGDIDGDIKLVTPAFILSHLTATLQQHIQYNCTIRKFGTLLFRPGTNLVKPLTQALWQELQWHPYIPLFI